jgi:hypothetical protein
MIDWETDKVKRKTNRHVEWNIKRYAQSQIERVQREAKETCRTNHKVIDTKTDKVQTSTYEEK